MSKSTPHRISRDAAGPIGPRRVVTLPIEAVHPVVRIAHVRHEPIDIGPRIIFDFEIVLLLEPAIGTFEIAGRTHTIRPHRLFVVPPFVPHQIVADPGRHVAIHFDLTPEVATTFDAYNDRAPYEIRLSHGHTLPTAVDLDRHHPIERALLELIERHEADDPLSELDAASLLLRAIVQLLRHPTNGTSADAERVPAGHHEQNRVRIARAIDYLRCEFAHELDVASLADAAGLSRTHFARQFSEWTGLTPMQYLRQVRIDHARKLLGDVDLSIKEIAAMCGFKSPYHFSKVFRQVDGLTPTRYREALLAGKA